MRLVRVALSALSGVVLAASSAVAADIAAIPPPPVWGFYFGGGVCYDWADFDIDKDIYKKKKVKDEYGYPVRDSYGDYVYEFKHKYNIDLFDIAAKAPCATVSIGWDHQIDQLFVIGAFFSYDWQLEDKRGDITKDIYYNYQNKTITLASASIGNIATVGGRAGILVQPDLLVYFLLGYSWTDAYFAILPDWNGGIGASGGVSGPTVGLGAEKRFTPNLSLRGEVRYSDFGTLSTGLQHLYGKYYYEKSARITDTSVRLEFIFRP